MIILIWLIAVATGYYVGRLDGNSKGFDRGYTNAADIYRKRIKELTDYAEQLREEIRLHDTDDADVSDAWKRGGQ